MPSIPFLPLCGAAAIAQAAIFYILRRGRALNFWEATKLWFSTCAVGFALWWAEFYAWTLFASAQTEIDIAGGVGASAMLVALVFGTLLMIFFRPPRQLR
jgi:membrane associated rhomboid family serine protease